MRRWPEISAVLLLLSGFLWPDVSQAGMGVGDPSISRITSEVATRRPGGRTIRAVGTVQVDERKLHIVSSKYEGWIEKLHADATGQTVKKGLPLMEVYSPQLVLAQQEYLAASRAEVRLKEADPETRRTAGELAESALMRLRNWDIGEDQIKRLQKQGKASKTLAITSPTSGVVLEKTAIQGMRFQPGEMLYRIADLSTVWVLADVFEQDVGMVREGQAAEVTLSALPGKVFAGKVAFVYPTLTAETRTIKVRIELPNPDGLLRPALYANVLLTDPQEVAVVTVKEEAIWENNGRSMVVVERGQGVYEPRLVQRGNKSGERVDILLGLHEGEKVVLPVKVLVEADAKVKSALDKLSEGSLR